IHELRAVMESTRWMRRFDFDPEAVVRLCWHGIRPIKRSTPVRYLTKAEGGVSHFNYIRDNILLTWMHARLILGFLRRLPDLSRRGVRSFHR
ncbi:MAG: glycosyl transferase family 2, partial [Rhodospirillales bacterium]|nr:glycosyl transferase family 2 [Rhodospirillales bacterium]